jgi:uncharacterized protein YjiS (DUF1127 family)
MTAMRVPIARRGGRAFHSLVSTWREWRRRAHDRRELARLSDEMLHDIGISRAEALYLANRPFWRDDLVDLTRGDFDLAIHYGTGRYLGLRTMQRTTKRTG